MRRTSLAPDNAAVLGALLRESRLSQGFTVRRLEADSGVNIGSILGLESGSILAPQVDTLRALAVTLGLQLSDLFTVAGWLAPGELPTLRPYLRAKYRNLDDRAIADLERYAERLAHRAGTTGPHDHEDEAPELNNP